MDLIEYIIITTTTGFSCIGCLIICFLLYKCKFVSLSCQYVIMLCAITESMST